MFEENDKLINILELVFDYYEENNLLNSGIKIYYTKPFFKIKDEKTYLAFKKYFNKAGEYILNSDIYNGLEKFFCKNILETKSYEDYISKFPQNVAISYVRNKKCLTTI